MCLWVNGGRRMRCLHQIVFLLLLQIICWAQDTTSATEASFPACWRWRSQETVGLTLSCHRVEPEVGELACILMRFPQRFTRTDVKLRVCNHKLMQCFLLHLSLHSHGAAVQRGAGFGSGGFTARRGSRDSEILWRRRRVPSCGQNLCLRTRGSGETSS